MVNKSVVTNLLNGDRYTYSLLPERVVICAYHQFEKGDMSSWNYKYDCSEIQFGGLGYTVSCGNMVSLLPNVYYKY